MWRDARSGAVSLSVIVQLQPAGQQVSGECNGGERGRTDGAAAQDQQQNQQAVTSDVSTVNSDLSGLSQDSNFSQDLAAVTSALSSAQADLSTVQSDAQSNGQECPDIPRLERRIRRDR